ncbi:MAG: protein-disulfide reductase DsbD family protein [Alphaproteobacteria bacterium]|nr:protein-disulfide reductase DsbD family protein [Alphaproteobacteria bacterium]
MLKRLLSASQFGLLALIAVGFLPQMAHGEEAASAWEKGPKAEVRLIAATTAVGELEAIPLGIEVKLQPGWKTYWRSPGDAGIPPQVDFTGSSNVASTEFRWPVPTRFQYFDLETFGYSKEVVFPIDVELERPGEPAMLRARVDMLICDDVCIPHTMNVSLDLPAGPAAPSDHVNVINQYSARVPGDGTGVGLSFEAASFSGSNTNPLLEVAFRGAVPFVNPDLLIEGSEDHAFSRPEFQITDGGMLAIARVSAEDIFGDGAPVDLAAQPVTLTLFDGNRSIETQVTPTPGPLAVDGATMHYVTLLSIVGLALIGGLILNLMPCVLPVLSIKLLSVVSHGGGDPKQVRLGFLATTAGIVVSFLALATLAVGVKAAGLAVGWGIQFQHPVFIIAIVVILTLFAANMWGLFEINLPGQVSDVAVKASGGTSLRGNFFQGAFATLLATPCTAPFLGTSIGFALSRGAIEIYAVFAALGVGMALPFILVAIFPVLATKLPRPGPWMNWLKKFLALALVATAVWLLSVMGFQVSATAAFVVGALMAAIAVLFAVRRYVTPSMMRAVPAAIVIVIAGAFATPATLSALNLNGDDAPRALASDWRPFDQAAIPQLVAAGNVVFVDVTAEWCITCQVNKRRVLQTGDVAGVLNSSKVIMMRADWTKPNNQIANYLASFNRFGIPFNVIYGPNSPSGVVLPELLSKGAVFAGLEKAGFSADVASAN